MNDLVEKMMRAFADTMLEMGEPSPVYLEGMTAAAKVLLEAALGEPTKEEAQVALKEQAEFERTMTERHKHTFTHSVAMRIFANRKARLLAPKTLEERVTVVPTNIDNYSNVLLDGKSVGPGSMRNDYAQTFAKGLIAEMIAEMKEKGCSSK